MAIRVLIVDDESLARDTIRLLLGDRAAFDIVGECRNGNEAVEAIRTRHPDLVFLDIQMPGLTGFEVVEEIGPENMPVVVFATAYDQYALKAFDAQALDYLLKPFDDERFEKTLARAVDQVRKRKLGALGSELAALASDQGLASAPSSTLARPPVFARPPAPAPPAGETEPAADRIMIRDRDSVVFVPIADIDRIESAGDYVTIHVGKKSHLLRETMNGMEARLDPRRFVRIHRSTIVQLDRIRELKPFFHGDYVVYLKDSTELRLSRRYWGRLERLMASRP